MVSSLFFVVFCYNKISVRESDMKKILCVATGLLATILLIVYGAGCYYFQSHFYYGTTIDGTVYGCMTEPEVCSDLIRKQSGYALAVNGRNGLTDVLEGTDAGMAFDPEEELLQILGRQIVWMWPLSFFETHEYSLTDSVRVDEEQFRKAAGKLSLFQHRNMQSPKDARLSSYSPVEKGYYIVPEVEGNRIHREEALEVILEAFKNQETELELTDEKFYDCPVLRADDEALIRKAEQLNAFTGMVFTYNMHGVEVTVDGDQIHEWLTEEDGQISIDQEKALAYVQELADTYDTYGKERSFTTVSGEKMTLRSGAYGWKLDVKAEQEALLAMLKAGKSCHREPEWKKKGYVEGSSDIGNTYVEIDLGAQHLYLVENGNVILESDLVSGNAARGWSTPSGVFGLTYKTRNAVLRGADYATPVSYWMPFNRNIGMHDATWRGSFGGTIYKTNGSHGCINLPYNKAKEIYNFVKTNMPVVCYY